MTHLELEEPLFIGSSFGGNVALQLAHRRPERFTGVLSVEGADYLIEALEVLQRVKTNA